MALVTRGTAKDGRIRITSTLNDSQSPQLSAVTRGGYRVFIDNMYDGYYWFLEVRRISDNTLVAAVEAIETDDPTFDIEMVGSVITIKDVATAETVLTATDSTVTTVGVWQSDPDYCDFINFTNLDAPAGYTVGISAGSNGSVSTSSLSDVDNTTGKTFTATPSAGYRIASITPSTGVTVTPAASGQTSTTTFTVKATQAGTVAVAFEVVPTVYKPRRQRMMNLGGF